jgi:hypothetical protein
MQRNCLNGLQIYYWLVEMLEMLERVTNLSNLIEASEVKSKSNSFQEKKYLGKPSGLA